MPSKKPATKPRSRKQSRTGKPAPAKPVQAAVQKLLAFDVFNRWTGAIQFTAQIDCQPGELPSIKMGLAVRWAVKNGARLDGARLDRARLDGASLDGASLDGARLDGARLDGASLDGARLDGARLDGARLDGARLDRARLVGASLDGASLVGASLDGARLDGASLDGARLDGAKIKDADGRIHELAAGASLYLLGQPNGWSAYTYFTKTGEQRVRVGCRDKTIPEGRAYWAGIGSRHEVMCALDYAEAIGRARNWGRVPVAQAAE